MGSTPAAFVQLENLDLPIDAIVIAVKGMGFNLLTRAVCRNSDRRERAEP